MLAGAVPFAGCALARDSRRKMFSDDFQHGLGQWVVEAQAQTTVTAQGGILDIDSAEGITLWFREPLVAPVTIEYDVLAVSEGGPHDAVSDVNAFWMATDPAAPGGSVLARRRSGTFADYDLIRTYYTGIGGNRNTTTRMRRYIGAAGNRPILPEHDRSDAAALLVPNRWMHLRLNADAHGATVERDGVPLFRYDDPEPYTHGHFGLRTTRSHLRVRNFRVTEG
ncbi:Tat pathway signal sequence domain protein [Sphingomonas sp. JC676]|nr:Tat pathway signal sequence domain protein [Sphingomonas sp. JC676]